jgi:hypothetical protein
MTRPPFAVRAARLVAVLVAVAVTLSMTGCAGAEPPSDAPVYLVNNTTAVDFPDGTSVDWNTDQGVVLCSFPLLGAPPADENQMALPAPTNGALDFIPFLAQKGSERNKSSWKLWGNSTPLGGGGALLPAVWPGYFTNGDAKAVKSAGGTYSMGVAYLKDDKKTVVSAYYTTITIDAGTGTWKFTTPKH